MCHPYLLKIPWQLCRQLLSLIMVLYIQRDGMYGYLLCMSNVEKQEAGVTKAV